MKVKHFLFAITATVFAACTNETNEQPISNNEYQIFGEVLIDGKPAEMSRATGSWSGLGKHKGDQTANVSYTAPAGYTVKKITESPDNKSSSSSSLSFPIDYKDHTVSAELESTAKYTNTVTAGTGGTASGTYTGKTGDTHSIKATANSGYTFSGWTTSGGATVTSSSSASTTAKIGSSNGTITANFKKDTPSEISVSISARQSGYRPGCTSMQVIASMSPSDMSHPSISVSVTVLYTRDGSSESQQRTLSISIPSGASYGSTTLSDYQGINLQDGPSVQSVSPTSWGTNPKYTVTW